MQGVSMATERADRKTVITQRRLKRFQLVRVIKHRQLTVRIARIVTGSEFNGRDAQAGQFPEHFVQRQTGQQGRKNTNFH
jgi:hypothetical protein